MQVKLSKTHSRLPQSVFFHIAYHIASYKKCNFTGLVFYFVHRSVYRAVVYMSQGKNGNSLRGRDSLD